MGSPRRRLILELDERDGLIAGSLTDERGVERTFHGWLELGLALEAAVVSPADRPGPLEVPSARPPRSERPP